MNHVIAPIALDGWYVLHQFLRTAPAPDDEDRRRRRARAEELAELFGGWDDLGEGGWSGLYRIVGGGADHMALHFRPTLDALGDAERALRLTDASGELAVVGDYVSVVELGLYHHTAALLQRAADEDVEPGSGPWNEWVEEALAQEREKRYVQGRLFPRQPDDMPYVCFYPMDKRRAPDQNWYALTVEERAELMTAHGAIGRRWAGKVSQVISGSVGFDDWEWGVTLFAGDPLEFKNLVTEMRYDEASAVYAEFGRFWVGRRVRPGDLVEELAGPQSGAT